MPFKNITPQQASAMLKDGALLIDVRTPAEFAYERINGSVNINVHSPSFKEDIQALNKSKDYVVYCRTGVRSLFAAKLMSSMGFRASNLKGGIEEWKNQSNPVI